ncbi:Coat F domain protein [compost metagenome]
MFPFLHVLPIPIFRMVPISSLSYPDFKSFHPILYYAMAITEAVTLEIRETLKQQLEQNINLYEQVSSYMI